MLAAPRAMYRKVTQVLQHCISKGNSSSAKEGEEEAQNPIWGFPKIRGTILGVPIIRTIVFGVLHWSPPTLRNYYILAMPSIFRVPQGTARQSRIKI